MNPPGIVFKVATSIHRNIIKLSGGRWGWNVSDMPVIDLVTTGRKSGKKRSTMLTTPWSDGDSVAIVASAGGHDQHPAWFLNLQANPSVEVQAEDGTTSMTARILEGEERASVFEEIATKYTNYADYQEKTTRVIPVVILDPA